MSEAVAVIPVAKQSLVAKFASRFSIEPEKLMPILKATAFKVKDGEVTNEQMAALLVVADQYGLNPFTKEIYAYPDKQNGIVPVVGVDGWSRILNSHPMLDGIEFRYADEVEAPEHGKACPVWIEAVISRKDRSKPTIVREHLDESYRKPFKTREGGTISGPWQSHTKRMLRHKALIQGGRLAFGFAGIYDEDEAQRIIDVQGERVVDEPAPPQTRTDAIKDKLRQRAAKEPEQAATPPAAPPSAEPPVSGPSLGDVVALLKKGDLDGAADIARELAGADAGGRAGGD
jgi:phage recombination protein Bet